MIIVAFFNASCDLFACWPPRIILLLLSICCWWNLKSVFYPVIESAENSPFGQYHPFILSWPLIFVALSLNLSKDYTHNSIHKAELKFLSHYSTPFRQLDHWWHNYPLPHPEHPCIYFFPIFSHLISFTDHARVVTFAANSREIVIICRQNIYMNRTSGQKGPFTNTMRVGRLCSMFFCFLPPFWHSSLSRLN